MANHYNRFMIGQYGAFDEAKYRRDFRTGFCGIEACLFEREEDWSKLIQASRRDGFRIGIHFPLRAGRSELRDALFLALDDEVRAQAFELIGRELDDLIAVKPDYVLFHYPKPVILDDRVDWSGWRFADRREHELESRYSFEELKARSATLFDWLSAAGEAHRFTPVLEFDVLNRYICETDFLERLLDEHPRIRLCLDTGRLHAQDRLDPRFDARSIIRRFARYAEIIHLKNVRITDRPTKSNHPVLPHLSTADGWAPIEDYLRILARENAEAKIMFEHRSDWISDDELERCYRWVDECLNATDA
ncbi:sugar phosphate isomerase/epimerase [Paenibacillus glycinis]|nr:sugar phosphate isomerase/epimerase [Paenibacillus glycinis]